MKWLAILLYRSNSSASIKAQLKIKGKAVCCITIWTYLQLLTIQHFQIRSIPEYCSFFLEGLQFVIEGIRKKWQKLSSQAAGK